MAIGREAILNLYRNLLKESKKWNSYNYREYALRKVKHEFRQNKIITDAASIGTCYDKGLEALQTIKRQVILGNMYGTRPLVIETRKLGHSDENSAIK